MRARGGAAPGPRRAALAIAAGLLALFLAACGSSAPRTPAPDPTPPSGWTQPDLTTADGTTLDLHLWERDPARLVIFVHEYLVDQSSWWPLLDAVPLDASMLTFDLPGHGETLGELDDRAQMLDDTRAVLAFAREHGYEEIVLVGSGMGAAIAMLVAADEPDLSVIALSAPSEFSDLVPADVVGQLTDRLVLIAAEGDLSAAHSLETLVELAGLPGDRWRMLEGRLHGVDMLVGEEQAPARTYFTEMLRLAWGE